MEVKKANWIGLSLSLNIVWYITLLAMKQADIHPATIIEIDMMHNSWSLKLGKYKKHWRDFATPSLDGPVDVYKFVTIYPVPVIQFVWWSNGLIYEALWMSTAGQTPTVVVLSSFLIIFQR